MGAEGRHEEPERVAESVRDKVHVGAAVTGPEALRLEVREVDVATLEALGGGLDEQRHSLACAVATRDRFSVGRKVWGSEQAKQAGNAWDAPVVTGRPSSASRGFTSVS